MAIILNRFDGGEVDFLSARDLADNQFQVFTNLAPDHVGRAVKSKSSMSLVGNITNSYAIPGQGNFMHRAEWDDSATPAQTSSIFYILARIVNSAGAWEINIHRWNAKNNALGSWGTEFIDETSAKGGWERGTSNRLVQGASNITFTAATDRISGHANLENYEVGEKIRVFNTTSNNGYFTVKAKAPAANSVDVQEALTDEANVSAYIYPLPNISMFAVNGGLRISNGNFYDAHPSQWYNHIKRDFWGQGVTYGSNGGRFSQPPMKEAYNAWKLEAQELVAPTIKPGWRRGQVTSAANQIAIHIADSHHEFKELMPNAIDRTFTGGGTAWANVDLNAFDETTDLSITANAAKQYCTCPVASAPMTAGVKYTLKFDLANIVSTWTIQDFTGVQKFGTVMADGEGQSIKFTVEDGITGGLRLVADTDESDGDFDNFSLSAIEWPEKSVDTEWNDRDRVTATFVYDFVQESELGKAADGEIGIPMGAVVNADIARAFMLDVYTGASNASWNRRRTAIRIYYKFHDDPDWYEVVTLDVNKGWSESDLVFDKENTGYWIPIIDTVDDTGTTDAAGGSGTTVNSVGHGLATDDLVYFHSKYRILPDSLFTKPSSFAANTMTLPVAMVDSLGINPANYNSLDWCAGDRSTTAVGTLYIPFTGEKTFTYFTNTARAAKLKVPAIRWGACDTDGSRVLYGNIDTKDENEQTVRERSRVIETQPGMPDVALLSMSKDVGLNLGDEIIDIRYYNRNWWVLMERNIVVLQPGTLKKIAHFTGIGCKWKHANAITPYGLVVADESSITLLPSGKEITFLRRDSYQSLTFFESAMSYDREIRKLFFIPDTGSVTMDSLIWVYNFDNESLTRDDLDAEGSSLPRICGNFIDMAENDRPAFVYSLDTGAYIIAVQLKGPNVAGATISEIKTKEYDLEKPYLNKKIGNGYLSYLSSSKEVLVEVYLDGNSLPAKTARLPISSIMTNAKIAFNVTAKLFSFDFKNTATDLEFEDFIVPDKEITFLDR